MRELLILLFFLSTFISCKDETNPDAAEMFVGSWTTEKQTSADQEYWITYDIQKVSSDLLRIEVGEHFVFPDGRFDNYVDQYKFDNVMIKGDNSLTINSSRTLANQQTISYLGNGRLKDGYLIFNINIDYDSQGIENMVNIKLQKK